MPILRYAQDMLRTDASFRGPSLRSLRMTTEGGFIPRDHDIQSTPFVILSPNEVGREESQLNVNHTLLLLALHYPPVSNNGSGTKYPLFHLPPIMV